MTHFIISGYTRQDFEHTIYHTRDEHANHCTTIVLHLKHNYVMNKTYFRAWVMVFNATVNNIPGISWRSVLLVEETGVPGETPHPVASHRRTLSHNVASSTP